MQRFTICLASRRVAPFALATLLGSITTGVHAESDPYYLGISQSLGHNSNIYRTGNSEVPDKFAVTSLNVGFDQPIGRQRVFANVSARSTRYEDIRILDHIGYGLNAGLDWSTIERLSGSFGVASNRTLANYAASGNQQTVPQTKKNTETSSQANLRVQLGLVSLVSLDATLSHSQISYSAIEYQFSEVRQNVASLGLTYRPGGALTLGAGLRVTRGEYPNVPSTSVPVSSGGETETFDRKDLDLTATWAASGLSTLNARLSYGRSAYDTLAARNFKGATGLLGWAWKPTGKLSFNTSLSRDSGTETSFFALANNQGSAVGDNSVVTNAFALNAGYEASAKIRLNLDLRYARRLLVNAQIVNSAPQGPTEGRDNVTSVTLGASYAASRNWHLGCNAGQDTAKPSNPSSGLSTQYTATQASCNLQFTIR